MPGRGRKPDDLREACIEEAVKIVAEAGVENLSLREVSRRLGVSHQAPYKHFPSRDHILAEIVARAFQDFAAFLEGRATPDDATEDLCHMGACYMDYARANPLKYRLMFNTPLPAPHDHPGMVADAQYAYAILHNRLQGMTRPAVAGRPASAKLDALFVWATLHGLATLIQSGVVHPLDLTDQDRQDAVAHVLARVRMALEPAGRP